MSKKPNDTESVRGLYLAVFTGKKNSAKWRAWRAMTEEEQRAKAELGIVALKTWDEDHAVDIVYAGGPLGPTKRTSDAGIADVVNELTAFVVVRAPLARSGRETVRKPPPHDDLPVRQRRRDAATWSVRVRRFDNELFGR